MVGRERGEDERELVMRDEGGWLRVFVAAEIGNRSYCSVGKCLRTGQARYWLQLVN